MTIITDIVSQYADEAAFLWLLHSNAIYQPHYGLKDLARLDERAEAHLDGLRVAGEPGWELCKAALEDGGAGEVFAASGRKQWGQILYCASRNSRSETG